MPSLESASPWKKTRCLLSSPGGLFTFVRSCSVKVIIILTQNALLVVRVVRVSVKQSHNTWQSKCLGTYLLLRNLLPLEVLACPVKIVFLRVFECARSQTLPNRFEAPFHLYCSVRPSRCVGLEELIRQLRNTWIYLLHVWSELGSLCFLHLFACWSLLGPFLITTWSVSFEQI